VQTIVAHSWKSREECNGSCSMSTVTQVRPRLQVMNENMTNSKALMFEVLGIIVALRSTLNVVCASKAGGVLKRFLKRVDNNLRRLIEQGPAKYLSSSKF
jgi:hypothetical protein